ncbi:transcription initiation factor IIF [Bombiscardovia apis]|uniref:Transcription initiation factor IIF n=1 Tax=Bombiscardovia apis TaxID=2932182 RepID=A0ABN6SJS6_9BIFI|nr:LytR C-terminal domain-containing protein [Bombiscardovia apis]BDR54925.1 transcription initiation factor IIF [Bombiscardovia apis]
MASNRDENGYQPYTPDAFDDPPEGPVGVHRGPRSLAVRTVPFVAIIILAILCGIGAWTVLSGSKLPWQHSQTSTSQASQQQTAHQKSSTSNNTDSSKPKESQTAQPSTSAGESEQAAPAPAANKAAAVKVVNGTSTAGYAASKKQVLESAGYTNVTAANPAGQLPQASVVWYQSESDKVTAEEVAKTLGIASVEQSADAGTGIVAVLLN